MKFLHLIDHRHRTRAYALALGALLTAFSGLAVLPGEAQAQSRWLQNVELVTPVRDGYVTRALLDTLTYALLDSPEPVRRTPDDATAIPFHALEESLFDDGLDFSSATNLFVGYKLEANQRRFSSNITHLYFIYRPEDGEGLDIPILYLNGTNPIVQRILETSGTPSRLNEAAIHPFIDQMTFHKLPEGTVVSVGGRIIRDPAEAAAEKERLLSTIRRFLFQ